MPKKKTPAKPAFVQKPIRFPQDWINRIDSVRGAESFSEFVRQAVLAKLGTNSHGLSEIPGWGGDRVK